jgi:CHAT domain-containing protein/tetratricopeptide (TPR) repeat protein
MRPAPTLRRATGPLAVAALALLLTSGGSPQPSGGAVAAPPNPIREARGVAPQGLLGPEPAERALGAGQGHGWLLRLEAGELGHVRVDQLGADVAVALFEPAGRFLIEIDTFTPLGHDGEEDLYLRASSTGVYRLELRSVDQRGPDAGYRVRLVERRPATAADLLRIEAESLFQRATALRSAGRLTEALPSLDRSEALFARLGDERRRAAVRQGRCAVRYRLGDYRRAQPACEGAAALYRQLGEDLELASALDMLGKIQLNLDDPWSAIRTLEEALHVAEARGDSWFVAEVHTDLAMAHRQLSHFPHALAAFGRGLETWERLGEIDRAALVLHERGLLYRELGDLDRATEHFRRALERMAAGDPQRPLTLIALGLALSEQGAGTTALQPLQEALGPLEEALGIEERIGDGGGAARVLTAIGLVHQQTGAPEEAILRYRRALPLAREAGDRGLLGDLYFNLGLLAGDGAATEAQALLGRALTEHQAAGNIEAQVTTRLALARAERARGRLHDGLQHLEIARILFLELRGRLPRLDHRISFMAHRYDLFDSAIDLLMELHRRNSDQGMDVRAFELSEQARGRGLLDLVGGRGGEPAAPTGRVLSVAEIQRGLLDPGTVLLAYKLGDVRSYLWVVEHDRFATFELPPRERLEALAVSFHRQLARPPRHAAAAALERTAAELSRSLLCPAREQLDGRRLLVVAEGELLYLPFAALGLGACDGGGGSPAPLAAEHPILAGPSASALAALRRRPRPRPARTLAVIADPVFDRCDPRIDPAHRGEGCNGSYPRLGHSAAEAEAILGLVPPGERAAALGFDARRDRLDDLMDASRFLHFATHTDIASEPPRLVLSRVDRRGRAIEPSYLTADEIAGRSLAADLVVLGACDTGSGRRFRGEGLVGLAHAFFEAGAGGVLVTLWPIEDRATAAFMERFYRHLIQENATPAAALARAQEEMRSTLRWRSPYSWAGFVLLGEGVPASPADGVQAEPRLVASRE